MSKLPKVVIVGRTNVGKSTLFNRLSVDVKSLMLDYHGVTRDFITDTICWQENCFELIDSGGISLQKTQDELAAKVQQIVFQLIESADIILFVCDGTIGLLPEDREIGNYLHKLNKKVMLIINKIDRNQAQQLSYEFLKLGFAHEYSISAQHGLGIHDVLNGIIPLLPKKITEDTEKTTSYRIVLLGKPNVGKSSLMNMLLERERSLVSTIAGTTREAITEPLTFYQETIALTDTPGIRRKRSVGEQLEQMMVKTSFRALDHAAIVLLLIDAASGVLSDQELKLAFYAFEQGKALIVLFNKEDTMNPQQRADLDVEMDRYDYFIKKIPHLFISCKTGKNIGRILPLVKKVWERHSQWLPAEELNRICKDALERTPLYHQSHKLVVHKAEQIATAPVTILLKVNQPLWFGPSQQAFFANVIRNHYDLLGAPLIMVPRKKG